MADSNRQKWVLGWGLVLGIWTVAAVVLTGQSILLLYSVNQSRPDLPAPNPSLPLNEIFWSNYIECVIWAFLTVGILWLGKRYPFGQGKWVRSLFVHTAACIACAFVETVLAVLVS